MPQVGDILRLTRSGLIFDQRPSNVFYFVLTQWTGGLTVSDALVNLFTGLNGIEGPVLHSALVWDTLLWENLTNPAERVDAPVNLTHSGSGEGLSPFDAFAIRLFCLDASTRSGWKRLPGVSESGVTNGGSVTPVTLTALQDIADEYAQDRGDVSSNYLVSPVVVGRNPDGTLNLTVINPIVSAQAQPFKTTQNTRKRGRGV